VLLARDEDDGVEVIGVSPAMGAIWVAVIAAL
jgi:hypothetical protein